MSELAAIAIMPRSVAGFVFDATFEEVHTSELEVTDSPIESGSSVTDHAFLKPYKLRITAGVTNTPFNVQLGDPFGEGDTRIKNAFRLLRELQARREPFSVNTGLTPYDNMVVVSLTTPQDKSSANAIVFTAELREVNIVYTQIVDYPARKPGKATSQASKKKDKGEQQGKEQEATSPQKKSALKRLSAALGRG